MQTIINSTPHPIHIVNSDGEVIRTFPKCDTPVRLTQKTVGDSPIDGVPTSRTVFGEAENLPDFEVGTFIIVSQLVKSALPHRTDLLVPAEVVRDENGNIIGCKSLGR